MKTSELTGAPLDWAVAKCEGVQFSKCAGFAGPGDWRPATRYSADWVQAGPIIDREGISVQECDGVWSASVKMPDGSWPSWGYGPTPLIAAMRCYVASKLGNDVDVPEELK